MKQQLINSFLIILTGLGLLSCEKNDLPQSTTDVPKIYMLATMNGAPISYQVGEGAYQANAYRLLNNHDSMLIYKFAIQDYLNSDRSYFEITINNSFAPYKNKNTDINSTLLPGSYKYSNQIPLPKNPKHLSEVTINWYNDLREKYSTYSLDQKFSTFNIVSVKDTIYKGLYGDIKYKKVVINFSCIMLNKEYGDTLRFSQGKTVAIF